MSYFSKTEDYSTNKNEKISHERGDERVSVKFEEGNEHYGSHNRPSKEKEQGERHETHWDGINKTRESVDIDSDGNPIESTRHRK